MAREVQYLNEKYFLEEGSVGLRRANDHAAETVGDAVCTDGLVSLVPAVATALALFFDVGNIAISGDLVIAP